MAESLMTVGIILVIIWFFVRRSMNYKPGSKNWAINTDIVIDELKSQYEPVEDLKNITRDHEKRVSRIEMDLERIHAIINMENKPSRRKKEEKILNG